MGTGPLLLLAVYSVAIVAASLLGGWLPSLLRMTHTRMQVTMSFVAGLMLGVALYHLLPHALAQIGGPQAIDTAVWWVMAGLVLMLLLLRLFHFHQHDFSDEHEVHHHHHEGQTESAGAHPLSWLGIAFGLGLHTLIDGIALGAAVRSEWAAGAGLVGVGVFLAILLHKPLDALSITSMMRAGGWGQRATTVANLCFAMMCPLGALVFIWGVAQLGADRDLVVGCALAFSAGVFLCISLSDLLPEVHFHSHDKAILTLSFLLGIVLAYALGFLEPNATHALEVLS
jgi:zinc and cadmium transporter